MNTDLDNDELPFDVRFAAEQKHVRAIMRAFKAAKRAWDKGDQDTADGIIGALLAVARACEAHRNRPDVMECEAFYLAALIRWAQRRGP